MRESSPARSSLTPAPTTSGITTARGWIIPPAHDGSPASLAAHAAAITAMIDGEAPLWLGPFAPPLPAQQLPAGYERTALVVPTSGSTGRARAVALDAAALTASHDATARALASGVASDDPLRGHGLWLPLLPPTHIAGVQVIARAVRAARLRGLERPLLPGAPSDLARHFDEHAFADAAAPALDAAQKAGVAACTSLVPTQLSRLMAASGRPGARARDLLARFDVVLVGGAATDRGLRERTLAAGVRLRTTYGSSETAGGCVYDGVPLDGVRLRLAEGGRLAISSPTLAGGYLRSDGGAEDGAFTQGAHGRELLTTDLAEIHDGRLRILGRADDVIITGGRKVLPQDVEQALDASPALAGRIAERVVVGVPDPQWGERLVALIVPSTANADRTPGGQAGHEGLADLVPSALRGDGLASHAVPKRTLLVDALPLLGIGKIDRSAARHEAIARGA